MSKNYQAATLSLVAAATLATQAWALDPVGYKTAEDLLITPGLQVSERWDDNFRSVEAGEESSFVTTVAPRVNFNAKGRKTEFNLDFGVSHDIFHSSHGDDNTDRNAGASLALTFDRRNRLNLNAGFVHVEDTSSLVQNLQNDIHEQFDAGLTYGYGAETARGQLEFGASTSRLRFRNDMVLLGGAVLNADRERDADQLKGIFYVALAPKTKALFEVRQTEFSYVSNSILDSTNTALLAGVKWEATAQTQGTVKVGSETKEFESAALGETDNAMWEVSVIWSPLSYSTFTLSANSRFDEGNNGASVIEAQSTALDWRHQWLKRLSTNANLAVSSQDYVGAPVNLGGADRADEILTAGFGVTYAMRRWLDIGLGYQFSQNDSNAPTHSYERNLVALTANASL